MPAASWSFRAATRTWKNSSRLIEHDGAELGPLEQWNAGLVGERQDAVVEVEPAQLTVEEALVVSDPLRQQGCHTRPRSISLRRRGDRVPIRARCSSRSASRLIRSRLRRNCGSSRGSSTSRASARGPELVEHGAVAPVAEDLPVRRDRSEIDDTGVRSVVVGRRDRSCPAECTWRFRASSNASGHDEPVTAGTRAIPRTRLEPGVEPDRMVDTSLQLC